MLRVRAGQIDLARRVLVLHEGSRVRLTERECALLTYLSARPAQTIPRGQLLAEVWDYHHNARTRAVDHTMRRLRAKVELDPSEPEHLLSDYGSGYRFVALPAEPAPAHSAPWISWGTRFFGREAELAQVRTVLASARCCLIHGRAGVGKTRLARQLARERRLGGDDARVVGLGEMRDADAIAGALALALELPNPRALADVGEVLAAWGRLCLVLDESEASLGVLGPELRRWLRQAPDLTVVLTARQPHSGLESVALDGLTAEAARALLLDRASLAGVEDAAPPADELDRLAAGVDRLPLALELIAPRLRLMGAARLARLLGEQSTDAVRASVMALSEDDRAVLSVLARFRSPFDVDLAVAAVGAGELDRLQRLVDHGLLSRRNQGDDVRLFVLAPVRVVARQPCDAHDLAHARAAAQRAEAALARLGGPSHPEGVADLLDLRADLQEAWAVAMEHAPALAASLALALAEPTGRLLPTGLLEILGRTLGITTDPGRRVRLHLHRARVCINDGVSADADLEVALRSTELEVALDAAQMQAIRLLEGPQVALQQLAAIAGHGERAPLQAAKAERSAAVLEERAGRLDVASACLDRALKLAMSTGHPGEIAAARLYRGVLQLNRGRLGAARLDLAFVGHGLSAALPASQAADGLSSLGFVQAMSGTPELGRSSMAEAVAVLARSGERRLIPYALCNQGSLELFVGALDAAAVTFRDALDRAEQLGEIGMVGACRRRLATVRHLHGDLEGALDGYEAAMPELEAGGHGAEQALCLMQQALVVASRPDRSKAQACRRRAWRVMPESAHAPLPAVLDAYDALVDTRLEGRRSPPPAVRSLMDADPGHLALASRAPEARVVCALAGL